MLSRSFAEKGMGPYRLKQVDRGVFQIHRSRGPAFEGPKVKIFRKAIEMGISRKELKIALKTMKDNGHEVAEFGVNGFFLFSFTKLRSAA